MIKLHKCCSMCKSNDMRLKQVATTKSEKNVAFLVISTCMMPEAKTSGANNKHNTTAFYVGEMPIDMRTSLERYVL